MLPRKVVADVALLVTELVANGVRHGGADEDSYVQLLLQGSGPGLHVEVMNAERMPAWRRARAPDMAVAAASGSLVERCRAAGASAASRTPPSGSSSTAK